MRHLEATEEVRHLAALYALRALPPEEVAGFEAHLADGCRTCEVEVRAFGATAGLMGAAATAVSPPPELRARLLARLALEDSEWTIVRAGEQAWESGTVDGMWIKRLSRDAAEGRMTALWRLDGGVRYPGHRHAGAEELYVLDGELRLHGRVLRAGDYCAATGGSSHDDSTTTAGCIFLLSASEHDEPGAAGGSDERGLLFVAAGEGGWRETGSSGVSMRRLFKDPRHGTITGLVRMRPGAELPGHRHMTAEQFYMLDGDAHVAGHVLHAGDYYRAPRATSHESSFTEGGCTFLLISSHLELIEPRS